MTSLEIGGIATSGGVRFLGQRRPYWRLLIRGAALLMVTLGIYRFWLATDVRRFLWSNTEIAGEALEYTGTALELLLGFLVAIAILIPVHAGFFLVALDLGILGKLSGIIAFAALGVLGQYAIYRARRYRLTRTIYRGLRFHQQGSVLMAGASVTLAYPAFQAVMLRWWSSGLRFGDIKVRSRLRMRQVYGAYARFVGYAMLFSVAIGIIGALVLVPMGVVVSIGKVDTAGQIAATLVLLVGYVITALGFSTLYRATVLLSLWRFGMESLQLSGLSALERVKATGRPSSALGEGLADALNVGSY